MFCLLFCFSQQTNQIRLFFGRIYGAPILLLVLSDLYLDVWNYVPSWLWIHSSLPKKTKCSFRRSVFHFVCGNSIITVYSLILMRMHAHVKISSETHSVFSRKTLGKLSQSYINKTRWSILYSMLYPLFIMPNFSIICHGFRTLESGINVPPWINIALGKFGEKNKRTLRCQINESTRLAFLYFSHPTPTFSTLLD